MAPNRPSSATAAAAAAASHQPWFQGAPLTKLLCMIWVLMSLWSRHSSTSSASSTSGSSSRGILGQLFLYPSTSEMIIGGLFLAQLFKRLERDLGSRKFGAWYLWILLFVFVIHWFITIMLFTDQDLTSSTTSTIRKQQQAQAQQEGGNTASSSSHAHYFYSTSRIIQGPYAYMGAILYWYYMYIPRLEPRFLSFAGVSLSEKALQYAWGFYVITTCSSGTGKSIWFATVGFFASSLFFLFHDPLTNILMPNFIISNRQGVWDSIANLLFLDPPTKVYAPLLLATNTTNTNNPNTARGIAMGMNAMNMNNSNLYHRGVGGGLGTMGTVRPRRSVGSGGPTVAAATPPSPPSQEAIDQLTAMGFEETRVREALQETNNNIERAADRLLSG